MLRGCHCDVHKIVPCQPRAQVPRHPTRSRQRCVLASFQERQASHLRTLRRRRRTERRRSHPCCRRRAHLGLLMSSSGRSRRAEAQDRGSSNARTAMSSSERSATCVVNRRDDGHRLQCRGSCFLRVPWMMAALLAWCSSVPAQSLHCRTLAAESPVLGVIQYACGDSALHGLLHFASCCCDKSLATRFGCLKLGPRLTESNIECVILAGSSIVLKFTRASRCAPANRLIGG